MRVLIVTQYFTPEITAARARLDAFAAGLARCGHEVEVICEVPNHPEGVVHDGYRRRAVISRRLDGFDVRYVWVRASPVKSARNRLLSYGSYAAMATAVGAAVRRPDAIVASSPPLPVAAAAAVVAARHRVPWILDVRDVWPESAVALGQLTNARVIRVLERLERSLYRRASAIVTVTEPLRQDIASRVEDSGKVSVIANGTARSWFDAAASQVDRAEVGLPEDRFILTYAGNVGIAQGLDAALDAAALLDQDFRLLVLGDGPLLGRLRERAAEFPPGLVEFRGLVEPAEVLRCMKASDALLVPLGAHPMLRKALPSKLFDSCAVGRPVIVAAYGEARRVTLAADAALAVPPEDARALADAVRRLRSDPALGARLGERGRAFAARHLREDQIAQLDELIVAVAGAHR